MGEKTVDVAIIGGSVAGFFTAHLLAREGLQVHLFEGRERLDPTPRTLIVTHRMRELVGPVGESAVVNEIRRFELFADGRVATINLKRPDLVVERSTLTRTLAGQAESSGARVLFGRWFSGLKPNAKGVTLVLGKRSESTEEVSARILVGADGAFSKVGRAAGWPVQPTVPLVQAIVKLPPDLPSDTTRVWFIPEDTPYFYWLIPESPTRGVFGLIGTDGAQARRCLDRFLGKKGLVPIEFQAARIPQYTQWTPIRRQIGESQVYLVGDAAGQVKVTTVGGIVSGFRGAQSVAEAILNGGSSRELRGLRRELSLHLVIRKTLQHFTQADYIRLIDLLNPSARHSLSVYTRDEVGKVLWHLCLSQPHLLLLGLRTLLTKGSMPPRNGTASASCGR